MTIRRFNDWGRVIPRPEAVVWCDSDKAVADIASHYRHRHAPIPHICLTGGSLAASLGDSRVMSSTEVHELPVDLLHVTYRTTNDDERACVAANSVVMRRRWWRGHIVAITNGGYLGHWDIAPRAHPNDGRFDIVEVDPNMSYRQRLIARGRLPLGTHVPHPLISQRQSRSDSWSFTASVGLYVDEEYLGLIIEACVTIEPDVLKLVV